VTTIDDERLFVPRRVHAQLRAHALAAERDAEVGGELVVVDGVAVAYVPLENVSAQSGYFELDEAVPLPRPPSLLAHSHPKPHRADPSPGDVDYMRRNDLSELAIFGGHHDELRVIRLDPVGPITPMAIGNGIVVAR
jgi:hypothetical protein